MDDRDLYSGLIRLHILHHSVEGPIFGLEMVEELARHGYRISAGTLYPLLHGLEKKGYLRSTAERHGKSFRKIYRATRSEEHTSELQSLRHLVCRLLLEKKKTQETRRGINSV